jgi:uncharacterized protein DUF4399
VRGKRWGLTAAAILSLISLFAVACGSGSGSGSGSPTALARPSSTGQLTIESPSNGEVFSSSTVPVKVKLTGAKVVPATTTDIVPDQGHLHLTVDGNIVTMNFGTTDTLTDVAPGLHTLQVEFVASDHLPFDPRVIQQVTFEVKG